MTIAFVHGNPETSEIWTSLLAELGRNDAVTLSPPGFGAPVPDGFGATSQDYGDWLIRELEAFGHPVDMVGHDWGGGHVVRAVAQRPDLINRWCVDLAGCFDPDYKWHDLAQIWQTEGAGEAAVEAMVESPIDDRTAMFTSLGMTPQAATACAKAATAEMGRCILALYRSARQPQMALWGEQLTAALRQRPSLAIIATADTYTGGEVLATRVAQRWGSKIARLEGLGHWWMMQDAPAAAKVLAEFFC